MYIQTEIIEQATGYTQNVQDMGFALATGTVMVLVLISLLVAFVRNTLNRQREDYRSLESLINDLKKSNEENSEKICDNVTELKDRLGPLFTGMNIIIKRELNGSYDEQKKRKT